MTISIRDLLASSSQAVLWNGYIHNTAPDQDSVIEYFNVTRETQKVSILLMDPQGNSIPNGLVFSQELKPRGTVQISAKAALAQAGIQTFVGQCAMIFENVPPSKLKITPAITTHWLSATHHCEIANQGVGELNLSTSTRSKPFFMCCPTVITSDLTTSIILFNGSTDPAYQDEVEIHPVLHALDGTSLSGAPVRVAPYGMLGLDLALHFGEAGMKLLAKQGGYGSFSIAHSGHSFPAYFFHFDRHTNRAISGQHTQPPAYTISRSAIWWGKLRRYAFWS